MSFGPVETDNGMWYNICLVEEADGKVHEEELQYNSLREAYNDITILKGQIEPIETEVGIEEKDQECLTFRVN